MATESNELIKIKKQIENLREQLNKAQHAYYVHSQPIMNDGEYDKLFDQLLALEEQYPQFSDPNSPTVRVGSDIDQSLPEKPHTIPVLSLDKCYNSSDLAEWIEKNEKKYPGQIDLTVEPKIDGSGVVLYYQKGQLVSALTRGSGYIGNEITENIKTIHSVPLKIDYQGDLAVRGEIYIKVDEFHQFNQKYADGLYANPRNLASGAVRRQKSKEAALFPLNIFVYEGYFSDKVFSDHLSNLIYLKELGFPLNDHIAYFSDHGKKDILPFAQGIQGELDAIEGYLQQMTEARKKLAYEIDGLVIKINELRIRDELGFTSHHPRWAIAYKFEAPQAETEVVSIDIQVGRGGRITPVANLKPVKLSGSTISRATLHNQDYINAVGVNIGDRVTISKRGDVIPAVEEVLEKGKSAGSFQLPLSCPSCQTSLIEDGAHLFCPNIDCSQRVLGTLKHFVSKGQMDIETLGDKTIDFLFTQQLVSSIPGIYQFDYQKLLDFEGYKEKKIQNIIDSVSHSKEKPFSTVLSALGLKDIGSKVSELLAKNFLNIDEIIKIANKNDPLIFSSIDGIGELLAQTIIEHFNNSQVIQLISDLKNAGLCFELKENPQQLNTQDLFLSETKWVVTGSFENFKPRDKAKDIIKQYGGEILSAVSSKTSYLLCGSDAGSKLKKAQDLGISIIDEKRFLEIIEDKKI
ncbi:MAG: NAD-dependent DNA ligase LigA [Spirochaetes bacterium]|nr:NAD-dependent DNA ligase LigA [Spirochaetota bacterium]